MTLPVVFFRMFKFSSFKLKTYFSISYISTACCALTNWSLVRFNFRSQDSPQILQMELIPNGSCNWFQVEMGQMEFAKGSKSIRIGILPKTSTRVPPIGGWFVDLLVHLLLRRMWISLVTFSCRSSLPLLPSLVGSAALFLLKSSSTLSHPSSSSARRAPFSSCCGARLSSARGESPSRKALRS